MNSTKNFEINIVDLVKDKYLTEPVSDKLVKVYFKRNGSGPNPKPFIFPKIIVVDQEFMGAIGMYVGDGKLSGDKHHLDFTSKDPDMIKFMLDFFMNRFNLKLNDIRFSLTYKRLLDNSIKNWANYLEISKDEINLKKSDRHGDECLGMQIGGMILRYIFGRIIDKIVTSDFSNDIILRRAFLRGLFAAEGGIGIVKSENYIAYIAYHFSYEKEEKLLKLVQKMLSLEGIESKHMIRKNKGERYLQITNWRNYHKCWRIDLFRLNQRKELQFLNKLKITRFSCNINDELKERLLASANLSNRQLAFTIGILPATLCKFKRKEESYIKIDYLINLARINSMPLAEIKNNIVEFRVNDITPINDKQFIDFIFDLKNYA